MSTSSRRLRARHGPALLGHCFRPFFLAAAAWIIAFTTVVIAYLPLLAGRYRR